MFPSYKVVRSFGFPIFMPALQALWSNFCCCADGMLLPVAMFSKSAVYCLFGKLSSFFSSSPVRLFSFGILTGKALQLRVRSTTVWDTRTNYRRLLELRLSTLV